MWTSFVPLAVGLLLTPPPAPAERVDRRTALLRLPAALSLVVVPVTPAFASDARSLETIKVLAAKAKALRATVRSSAGKRRSLPLDPTPGINNYASTTLAVKRATASTLGPLQAEMASYASSASGLSEEALKQLSLQPLLMKGHMFELAQALGSYQFEEYTSRTTKLVYPGGKVERELEEICETADDFLALARGRAAPQRTD